MKSQISLNRRSAAKHLDKLLDDALEQTFPASDPVAIDFEQFNSSSLDAAVESTRTDQSLALSSRLSDQGRNVSFSASAKKRRSVFTK